MSATTVAPLDWYTEVGKALSRGIKNWDGLSGADKAAWVAEVLAEIESGKFTVTIPAALSKTGADLQVSLPRDVPLEQAGRV